MVSVKKWLVILAALVGIVAMGVSVQGCDDPNDDCDNCQKELP